MPFPTGSEPLWHKLQDRVVHLHYRWALFQQLYRAGDSAIDRLNASGSNIFHSFQQLLIDDICLSIARLTDPAQNSGNDNLSLAGLLVVLPADDLPALPEQVTALTRLAAPFRAHRNKRIAHADLGHSLKAAGGPVLPGITDEAIEGLLAALREIMNNIELKYCNGTTGYELTHIPADSGGHRLLSILESGLKAESDRDA